MSQTSETQKMLGVEITASGGPDMLAPREMPAPYPKPDEVRIRVEAAGVNRPDIMQRKGLYPVPPNASPLPGLEVAGVIDVLGKDVAKFASESSLQVGQKVVALTNGGGYAQYACVPAGQILPLPENFTFAQGAALPETFFTTYQTLIMRAQLAADQTFLVHGGSSGIGGAAIQIAKLIGAKTLCTISSDEKAAYAKNFGADETINYLTEDFEKSVDRLTDGRGVDVILDIIGGDYFERNIRCLARGGKLIQLSLQGGSQGQINLGQVLGKNLSIFGSTLRPQTNDTKAAIAAGLLKNVWPHWQTGNLKAPRIISFDLQDAASAHRAMEAPEHFGKIVLNCA